MKPKHIIQFYYFSSTFAATSPTFNWLYDNLHINGYFIYNGLFIQTKKTPNPDFLQFLPQSQIVMGTNDSVDIPD